MRNLLIGLVLNGCGVLIKEPPKLTSVTVDVSALLPDDLGCAFKAEDLSAVVLIEGIEEPCVLVVEAAPKAGGIGLSGSCPDVKTERKTITLRITSSASKKQLIGYSQGLADLSVTANPTVVLAFTPEMLTREPTPDLKDNEQTTALKAELDADADACSNYKEYCRGTLQADEMTACP